MIGLSLQTGSVGRTLGRFQNFKLRFCHGIALAVYPRERIISFVSANICEDAGGLGGSRLVRPSREYDGRKPCDDLFESRVLVDGVLPYLISKRSQIDFGISVTIKNTGFLVIEIHNCVVVSVVFKKRFISSNDFAVFLKPLTHTRSQLDESLDSICG